MFVATFSPLEFARYDGWVMSTSRSPLVLFPVYECEYISQISFDRIISINMNQFWNSRMNLVVQNSVWVGNSVRRPRRKLPHAVSEKRASRRAASRLSTATSRHISSRGIASSNSCRYLRARATRGGGRRRRRRNKLQLREFVSDLIKMNTKRKACGVAATSRVGTLEAELLRVCELQLICVLPKVYSMWMNQSGIRVVQIQNNVVNIGSV